MRYLIRIFLINLLKMFLDIIYMTKQNNNKPENFIFKFCIYPSTKNITPTWNV